jgi:hypothetical protein
MKKKSKPLSDWTVAGLVAVYFAILAGGIYTSYRIGLNHGELDQKDMEEEIYDLMEENLELAKELEICQGNLKILSRFITSQESGPECPLDGGTCE